MKNKHNRRELMPVENTCVSPYGLMRGRLNAYRNLCEEIARQTERLDRLEMRAYSAGGSKLSFTPKSPSTVYDKVAEDASTIEDLKSEIQSLIEEQKAERKQLEYLVSRLRNSGERALIRARYIDHEEWEDVQFALYGDEADYEENHDTYKQRMFKWHKRAIDNLSKL
ncbi:MAG: hypothetical protein II897_03850 [Clostridia bacterium]|nr:hypothetical protein [Clostridia bacterium]